ncbi:hypothetical protein EDD18DRAFT_1112215 [Armillaria luteobubalina]|uniref:Uncharacterized protein n=1 Tax=Armillaria luteobubalina TaxID=153913 RepID=A0AA39UKZ1_9AGAR|nr:hypothetical protein EDD18DRAFT_1112215 [Armillaria luteobubalina]
MSKKCFKCTADLYSTGVTAGSFQVVQYATLLVLRLCWKVLDRQSGIVPSVDESCIIEGSSCPALPAWSLTCAPSLILNNWGTIWTINTTQVWSETVRGGSQFDKDLVAALYIAFDYLDEHGTELVVYNATSAWVFCLESKDREEVALLPVAGNSRDQLAIAMKRSSLTRINKDTYMQIPSYNTARRETHTLTTVYLMVVVVVTDKTEVTRNHSVAAHHYSTVRRQEPCSSPPPKHKKQETSHDQNASNKKRDIKVEWRQESSSPPPMRRERQEQHRSGGRSHLRDHNETAVRREQSSSPYEPKGRVLVEYEREGGGENWVFQKGATWSDDGAMELEGRGRATSSITEGHQHADE